MTVSISYPGLDAGAASISLLVADPTKWALVDTRIIGIDDRESLFQYIGSDPEWPTTLRIGSYLKPGTVNQYNHSARLTFPCTRTDDVAETVEVVYDTIVVALTTHFAPMPTNAGALAQMVFSFFLATVGGDGFAQLAQRLTAWPIEDGAGPD